MWDKTGRFHMDKMYCDSTTEGLYEDYWIASQNYIGEGFIAELESRVPVIGVELRNTHNSNHKDRSTKKFRVSIGSSKTGPWTELLTKDLVDSRYQTTPPVQVFLGDEAVYGRFIKFDLLGFYGKGGGLNYFDVIIAASGVYL